MSPAKNNIYLALLVLTLTALIWYLPSIPGFVDDVNCWRIWSKYILDHGLKNTYDSPTNYLPVYQYVLWLYATLCGSHAAIEANVQYLRLITLAIDFLGLWYVYRWIDKKVNLYLLLLLSVINVAYLYNNILWGQVDSILAALAFIAIYYSAQNKLLKSCVWFTVAVCFKLQAIALLPLWSLLFLRSWLITKDAKVIITSIAAIFATVAIILLPFYFKENGLQQVYGVLTGYVGYMPQLTVSAANFWSWVGVDYESNVPDGTVLVGSITYRHAAFAMFSIALFFALFPLIRLIIGLLKGKADKTIPKEKIWLMGALSVLLFFFLNTQMHERYAHPAFIFICAYSFYTRDFVPYLLFSVAYLLNLEKMIHVFQLQNYDTVIFDFRFIAGLYAVCIFYLFFQLYKRTKLFKSWHGEKV